MLAFGCIRILRAQRQRVRPISRLPDRHRTHPEDVGPAGFGRSAAGFVCNSWGANHHEQLRQPWAPRRGSGPILKPLSSGPDYAYRSGAEPEQHGACVHSILPS